MATIKLLVTAEVSFVSGKFASRESIVEALINDGCSDPSTVSPEEGEYNVDGWDVEEYSDPLTPALRKRIARLIKLEEDVGLAIATGGLTEPGARAIVRSYRKLNPTPKSGEAS